MRVIPYKSGWDIALDMVFNDKQTAMIVAQRIRHALSALIRSAVDESMCEGTPGAATNARTAPQSATVRPAAGE